MTPVLKHRMFCCKLQKSFWQCVYFATLDMHNLYISQSVYLHVYLYIYLKPFSHYTWYRYFYSSHFIRRCLVRVAKAQLFAYTSLTYSTSKNSPKPNTWRLFWALCRFTCLGWEKGLSFFYIHNQVFWNGLSHVSLRPLFWANIR